MDVMNFFKENGIKVVNNASKKNLVVLTLEGDVNDGDYVTKETTFSLDNEESVKDLLLVLKVIREDEWDIKFCNDDYYFESNDSFTDEQKKLYNDFEMIVSFPSDSWGRCHTITDFDFKFYDEFGTVHELNIYE